MKTLVIFSFFILYNVTFSHMNALVYVAKDQVAFNQQEKSEFAQNENRKQLHSFLMHKNIANFETFWNILLEHFKLGGEGKSIMISYLHLARLWK